MNLKKTNQNLRKANQQDIFLKINESKFSRLLGAFCATYVVGHGLAIVSEWMFSAELAPGVVRTVLAAADPRSVFPRDRMASATPEPWPS